MTKELIAQRDQLREQIQTLQIQAEIATMESQLRYADHEARLIEGWGDPVDFMEPFQSERDFFNDTPDYRLRADDKRDGDNFPFFRSEQELLAIQGAGEWVATTDPTAAGALESLTSYVVHKGFTWTANPKVDDAPDDAIEFVQGAIDRFLESQDWCGCVDRELFQRTSKHGERFVWLKTDGRGLPCSEVIEPSWITEPSNPRQIEDHFGLPVLNWKYGIATTLNRPWEVHGYFVCRYGDVGDWDFVPAHEMSHAKLNVTRNVKRGLSDYYAGRDWIASAAKLLHRVIAGGTVQSSIALIREWEPKTKNERITNAADGTVEFQSRLPSGSASVGSRSIPTERFYAGKIVDVKGAKYHPGPMGSTNSDAFIEIVGAANRKASNRWCMPEFIYTGDASNANYASTLVSESPFVRYCESRQEGIVASDRGILWRVVWLECQRSGARYSYQDLRRIIDIEAETPDIATTNRQEQHEIRKEQHEAGILSLQSWAAAEGLDYEDERAKLASEPQDEPAATEVDPEEGRIPDLASRMLQQYEARQRVYMEALEKHGTS